jgi:hypothetical protein
MNVFDEIGNEAGTGELLRNLKDQKWRLNNLYHIKNEDGKDMLFNTNWVQEFLMDNLWFCNIVLKARQLGVTTFFCILFLDDVLFRGVDAGFIAQTKDDAKETFTDKVKYAWDAMPKVIKGMFEVESNRIGELTFKNKATGKISKIFVGTTLRGHTYQRIHISELSTIDQKRPEDSEEIRSGTLNSIHKGSIVVIESTSKQSDGLFYEYCNLAMDLQKMGADLTELDYKFFFFPWFIDEKYEMPGSIENMPKQLKKYFDELDTKLGYRLKEDKKFWYWKKWTTQKDKMQQEFPSTPEECFRTAIDGSYYAREIDLVLRQNRITDVPYDHRYPVDTWWDLGTTTDRKDSMSVVFTQKVGPWIHIIDFYGCSGEGLPHMKNVLNEKGYVYGTHWAPHDIEVVEVGSGRTRYEMAADLGIRFRVVPKLSFNDGIEASRMIMSKCWFNRDTTSGGTDVKKKSLFEALREYKKEWDDRLGKFKDKPLKNWSSDPCDAFRMMAVGIRSENQEQEELNNKTIEDSYDPLNPLSII